MMKISYINIFILILLYKVSDDRIEREVILREKISRKYRINFFHKMLRL